MNDTEVEEAEAEEIIKTLPIPHQIASRVAVMCRKEELSTGESIEIVAAHLAILMNLIEEDGVSARGNREELLGTMLSDVRTRTLEILAHSDSTKIWRKECH